jgi:hypothetical protein
MNLFNNYSNFDSNTPVVSKDSMRKAQDRRAEGKQALAKVNEIVDAPQYSGLSEAENIQRLLVFMQTGEGYIPALHAYLRAMDYEPADNIGDLAMQVMYARNEQVQDLVNKYDPDCYDEVAVMDDYESIDLTDQFEEEGFEGENYDDYKKRKLINYVPMVALGRAISKGLRSDDVREQKRAFRRQKQALKQQTVIARREAKLQEALHPERQAPSEGKPLMADMSQDQPIDSDTANAEIIGEEMERDTDGDMETFLPALGGIVALGTAVADAKKKGKPINVKVAWGKLKDLFKKKSPAEKAKIASELNLPVNASNQDVLNKLVDRVEQDKKEDYLRKNAPMIGMGLILIILIAFFVGKKS